MDAGIEADLVRLAAAFVRRLAGRARGHGIRWSALLALGDLQSRGPLTQRRLAARQGVTPATMSLLVRELRAEGLVAETRDPRDARRRRLHPTTAGVARLERDMAHLAAPLASVLADLREDERRALAAALPALLRALD